MAVVARRHLSRRAEFLKNMILGLWLFCCVRKGPLNATTEIIIFKMCAPFLTSALAVSDLSPSRAHFENDDFEEGLEGGEPTPLPPRAVTDY